MVLTRNRGRRQANRYGGRGGRGRGRTPGRDRGGRGPAPVNPPPLADNNNISPLDALPAAPVDGAPAVSTAAPAVPASALRLICRRLRLSPSSRLSLHHLKASLS